MESLEILCKETAKYCQAMQDRTSDAKIQARVAPLQITTQHLYDHAIQFKELNTGHLLQIAHILRSLVTLTALDLHSMPFLIEVTQRPLIEADLKSLQTRYSLVLAENPNEAAVVTAVWAENEALCENLKKFRAKKFQGNQIVACMNDVIKRCQVLVAIYPSLGLQAVIELGIAKRSIVNLDRGSVEHILGMAIQATQQ